MVDSVAPSAAVSGPDTVSALIDALGGPAKVGRIVGVGASTVSERKRSGVWPVDEWDLLIAAAAAAGISGVTYETLAKMHMPAERRASAEART